MSDVANVHDPNFSKDVLEQQLRDLARTDAEVRVFLQDYAQCKDFAAEGLFPSMVACSYFQPPSAVQYWAPTNIRRPVPESPAKSKKLTFSQGLDQFRIFLQEGETGCARFW